MHKPRPSETQQSTDVVYLGHPKIEVPVGGHCHQGDGTQEVTVHPGKGDYSVCLDGVDVYLVVDYNSLDLLGEVADRFNRYLDEGPTDECDDQTKFLNRKSGTVY